MDTSEILNLGIKRKSNIAILMIGTGTTLRITIDCTLLLGHPRIITLQDHPIIPAVGEWSTVCTTTITVQAVEGYGIDNQGNLLFPIRNQNSANVVPLLWPLHLC